MKQKIKNFFIKLGIGLVAIFSLIIIAVAVLVIWVGALIQSGFLWVTGRDGFSHNKRKSVHIKPVEKREYIEVSPKLPGGGYKPENIEAAFEKKPLPEPYSPTKNPLYEVEEKTPAAVVAEVTFNAVAENLKANLPPFDREKVFAAVDASNVRMSKKHRVKKPAVKKTIVKKAKKVSAKKKAK